MKATRWICILLVLVMALSVTACAAEDGNAENTPQSTAEATNSPDTKEPVADEPTTKTIIDMAGNELEIPADMSHIITVNSVATQAVLMLGGVDAATTIGRGCLEGDLLPQMFPEITEYEANGRYVASDLTVEAVMELNQTVGDSIVLNGSEDTLKMLWDAGCYAASFSVNGPEDLMNSIALIGEILGGEAAEKAEKYNAYYQANIDSVSSVTSEIAEDDKPTVLFVRGVTDTSMNVFQAENTFPHFWISTAGGRNAVETRGELTWDEIANIDPDVIITEKVSGKETILNTEAFASLSAVQNGKVYSGPFGVAVWTMGSTEEALTVLWAAKLLHPDLFPELDIQAETVNYYETFFDYTPSDEQVESILNGNG